MGSTTQKGRKAEELALEWLLGKGLLLREKNYRAGHKEIDLIMESAEKLHIVEVKSQGRPSEADPTDKIDARKQKLLAAAAGCYLAENHISKEVQFDVVKIVFDGTDFAVEYLPDAFFPIYYR